MTDWTVFPERVETLSKSCAMRTGTVILICVFFIGSGSERDGFVVAHVPAVDVVGDGTGDDIEQVVAVEVGDAQFGVGTPAGEDAVHHPGKLDLFPPIGWILAVAGGLDFVTCVAKIVCGLAVFEFFYFFVRDIHWFR